MNNKFIAMIILNPNIPIGKIDFIQSNISNVFEQNSKIRKVWFLGKKKLDYKIKKYTEGYHLKLEIMAKDKKVEEIKSILKKNSNVIYSFIIKDQEKKNNLPIIKKNPLPFTSAIQVNTLNTTNQNSKVYLLISKNLKLPFAESNILVMSTDINKIFEYANKELQSYIYVKGYRALITMKNIKDLEKELKRKWKVEFVLGNNPNIGQELLIQEKYLI
jgi:ribosomal protein S6